MRSARHSAYQAARPPSRFALALDGADCSRFQRTLSESIIVRDRAWPAGWASQCRKPGRALAGWAVVNPTRTDAHGIAVPGGGSARMLTHDTFKQAQQEPPVECFDLPSQRGVILLKPGSLPGNQDNSCGGRCLTSRPASSHNCPSLAEGTVRRIACDADVQDHERLYDPPEAVRVAAAPVSS